MAQRTRPKEIIYKANPTPRQPAPPDGRANRSLLLRVLFLLVLCGGLLFIPLIWQLYQLQIVQHDYYQELAVRNQTQDVTVTAGRGSILDRNGGVMAMSATVYNLILSPKDAAAKQEAVDRQAESDPKSYWDVNGAILDYLTGEFGLNEDWVRRCLDKTGYQYIAMVTEISDEDARQVREFIREHKLTAALYLTPTTKRFYPNGATASHLLGFMGYTETSGDQKVGAYGLEAYYESTLAGKAGRVVTAKNASGTEMLSSYEAYMDAEEGCELTTTADIKIQAMAEQALATAIEKYYVQKGGVIIVMNPNTGAILAMASSPDFDPNSYAAVTDADALEQLAGLAAQYGTDSDEYGKALEEAQTRQWRNKALSDGYEPGSTFKALVVAAALEEGAVSMTDTFYCGGVNNVGGWPIHCHKTTGHGSQSLTETLENSCNVALMEIGINRLGAERFWQYLEDYGLRDYTGVDIGGEGKGIFWSGGKDYFTSEIGLSSVATASFGQTFKVTPLRMITSFASVINGGYLLEPYLVESIADGEGNAVYHHEVTQVRQVLSASTSEKLRTMLESVVANGSGQNAYHAGYRIGGKTGTSEKTDERTGDVVCSFMGFAPADNPQILVLAAFDSPLRTSEGSRYTPGGTFISGGNIAAPTAGPLIAQILDYMGIEKQYANSKEFSGADVIVPPVTGKTLEEARSTLEGRNLTMRTVGEGDTVTGQIPAAGASIPGGSAVVLYLGAEPPAGTVTVPNLLGKSPSAVENTLNALGLYVRATGVSTYSAATSATYQSFAEGVEVSRGTVIEVRFTNDAIDDYVPVNIG